MTTFGTLLRAPLAVYHRVMPDGRPITFLVGMTLLGPIGCNLIERAGVRQDLALPRPPEPSKEIEARGELSSFDNGLRVLVAPDATANLVQVDLRIDIGAREDPADKTGLAHLAEHVAFALTTGGPPISRRLSTVALRSNAFTGFDTTHFQATVLPDGVQAVLGIYADLLRGRCDGIGEDIVNHERTIVLNELRLRSDLQARDAHDILLANIYPPGHAYARGLGGDAGTLAAIHAADLCAYYSSRYTTRRATVVIAGGVDSKWASAAAREVFDPLIARAPGARTNVDAWRGDGRRTSLLLTNTRPTVVLAFPFPARYSRDEMTMRIVKAALEIEIEGLRGDADIGDASCALLGGSEAPALVITASPRAGSNLKATEARLRRALKDVHGYFAYAVIVDLLRSMLRLGIYRAAEPLEGRARVYAAYAATGKHTALRGQDLAGIDRAEIATIQQAAYDLVRPAHGLTIEIQPVDADQPAGTDATWLAPTVHTPTSVSTSPNSMLSRIAPTSMGAVQDYRLSNGLRVLLAPQASMPILRVRLMIHGGRAPMPPGQRAVPVLAARLLSLPSVAFENLDVLRFFLGGGRAAINVDEAATVFASDGPAGHVEGMLAGLRAQALATDYDLKDVEAETKTLRVAPPEAEAERLVTAASVALRNALGGASRCVDDELSLGDGLKLYGIDALRAYRQSHYRAANATLIVAGQFDVTSVREAIDRTFGASSTAAFHFPAWNAGYGDAAVPGPDTREQVAGPRRILQAHPGRKQLHVALGYRLDPTIVTTPVEQRLLGALAQGAAAKLRDELGASYGFHAVTTNVCGADALLIFGDIDPARAHQALTLLRGELGKLAAGTGLDAAFAAAQREITYELLEESGDTAEITSNLVAAAKHNLAPNNSRTLAGRAAALQPQTLTPLLASTFAREREVMLCIGPTAALTRVCGEPR